MSASREKKKRQNQPEVPVTETSKKGMSQGLKRALTTVVAIVLVALVIFLGMVSTSFFEKHITVADANGHKLTAADVNYYYANGYNNISSYMGTLFDAEKPLNEQPYISDEFATWGDYVMDYAVATAADTYAIYDEAVAQGYTLTEEEQATIDNELASLSAFAPMYGYASADAFIAAQFGAGCNMKSYEEYVTVNTLANSYAQSAIDKLTYTEEDLDAYYNEHTEDFDSVSFRVFSVAPSLFPDETDEEAALKLCEEAAKAMAEAAQGNEQAFLDQAKELTLDEDAETYEPDTATLRHDYTLSACAEAYRQWLADDARQEGDATYVANGEQGYYVVYFLHNEDMSFQLPNVRHILISVTDPEDEAVKAEAQEKAQSILDEYLAGEQTEEAFAELAKTHSMDNAEEGGLYENITPGYMVESFEDWCYDESRQPGDTGIVESSYGYHIMYFCGLGDVYLDYAVENTMRQNDYDQWETDMTADVTYNVSKLASTLVTER